MTLRSIPEVKVSMTQSSDIRVAVSTVILTLRRTDDGRATSD